MKKDVFIKTLIGLLLLAPCAVIAQGNRPYEDAKKKAEYAKKKAEAAKKILKDSTVVLTYSDGNLLIENPEKGSLYLYAEGKEGYKATYYLFTSYPYIHLSEKSKADNGEYMAVKGGKGIKDILSGSVATYQHGLKMNETKPYRCFFWDKEESQILLSIDHRAQRTAKTILLVVRPELDDFSLEYNIKHGEEIMSFTKFKEIKFDQKNKNPLAGYTLLVKRSNRIVIDSISRISPLTKQKVNNENDYHDTPLRDGLFEIPLDGIDVDPECKDVEFRINYRMFDTDGKISSKDETLKLALSWESKGLIIESIGIKVIIVVLALIVALFIWKGGSIKKIIIHWIDKRNTERDDNNGEDNNDDDNNDNDNNDNDNDNTNSIKNLRIIIKKRNQQLETLKKKIEKIEGEKQELEREKNAEKNRADNAENNVNAKAARQINAIRTKAESDVAEANRIKDEAISRANNAEANANLAAETKINAVKQEFQKKLAEEANKTKLALQEVEAEKERSRNNLAKTIITITRERDEELKKRLETLNNKIDDLEKEKQELAKERNNEKLQAIEAKKNANNESAIQIAEILEKAKSDVEIERKNAKDAISRANKEAAKAKQVEEESRRRCDEVIKEIDALYGELKHNGAGMTADLVAEKVRQLEKIIIVKRNN